jgi:hypothetical protein
VRPKRWTWPDGGTAGKEISESSFSQTTILAAEAAQLLALCTAETILPATFVSISLLDPIADCLG